MEITKQEYQKYVQAREKSSPIVKNCVLAFAIGGGICVLGQAIMDGWTALGLEKTDAGTAGPLWRRGDAGAHHRLCQRGGLSGHRL